MLENKCYLERHGLQQSSGHKRHKQVKLRETETAYAISASSVIHQSPPSEGQTSLSLMKTVDQERKTSNRKRTKSQRETPDFSLSLSLSVCLSLSLSLSLSGDRGSDHITRCLLLPANRRPRYTQTHTHTAADLSHSCRTC